MCLLKREREREREEEEGGGGNEVSERGFFMTWQWLTDTFIWGVLAGHL